MFMCTVWHSHLLNGVHAYCWMAFTPTAKQYWHQPLKDVHTLLNDINTHTVKCCSDERFHGNVQNFSWMTLKLPLNSIHTYTWKMFTHCWMTLTHIQLNVVHRWKVCKRSNVQNFCWMAFTPAVHWPSTTLLSNVDTHCWTCPRTWLQHSHILLNDAHTSSCSTVQDSCCTKGLAMDSMPSAGQMRTTEVPRHTTRPRCRVSSVSLRGSSGSVTCTKRGCHRAAMSTERISSGSVNLHKDRNSHVPCSDYVQACFRQFWMSHIHFWDHEV